MIGRERGRREEERETGVGVGGRVSERLGHE